MTAFDDMTHRYAPDRVIIAKAMKLLPVKQYIVHPVGLHPDKCPIVPDMVALQCVTEKGDRWFGCERAYINSELRMVVVGHNSRDEVRRQWTPVPFEVQS